MDLLRQTSLFFGEIKEICSDHRLLYSNGIYPSRR